MVNKAAEIPESEVCYQVIEAGVKLLAPPPTVDGVLAVLESAEDLLSSLAQEPSQAIRDALLPAMKALISDKLLKNQNMDVKVSVLSCIHEIIRLGAPDAPYKEHCMAEIFEETVNNVFGKLSSFSGRTYSKALQILDTVAKLRSGLFLLEFGCNALISQMFQIFLDTIQPNHQDDVFSNMEEIMTRLIQENDEISLGLLKPLLTVVNKENQISLPPSRMLAEKVLKNCSEEVKPFLTDFVEQMRKEVEDCTYIISFIWPDMPGSKNVMQESEKDASDVPLLLEGGRSTQRDSYESSLVNEQTSMALTGRRNNEKMLVVDMEFVEAATVENGGISSAVVLPDGNNGTSKIVAFDEQVERLPIDEDNGQPDSLQTLEELGRSQEVLAVPGEDISKRLSGTEKVDQLPIVDEKPVEPDTLEIRGKVLHGRMEKNSTTVAGNEQVKILPKECVRPDASDIKRLGKRKARDEGLPVGKLNNFQTLAGPEQIELVQSPAKECYQSDTVVDWSVKLEHSVVSGNKTSSEKARKRKNYGKRKSLAEKVGQPKKEKVVKEDCDAEVLPKGCRKPKEGKEYREELLGSNILVWWPDDKQFYEGFVEGYDPSRKEHKVAYLDGDIEVLTLVKEHWLLCEHDETYTVKRNKKRRTEKEYREELVGSRVKVLWDYDHEYYEAVVESYDSIKGQHKVAYLDGDIDFVKLEVQNCILLADIPTQTDLSHSSAAPVKSKTPGRKRLVNLADMANAPNQ